MLILCSSSAHPLLILAFVSLSVLRVCRCCVPVDAACLLATLRRLRQQHCADCAFWRTDGSVVIGYRAVCCTCGSHTERVGLLHADSWDGAYTRVGVPIFQDGEDLFMWLTERGELLSSHDHASPLPPALAHAHPPTMHLAHHSAGTHMIYHSQATDHGTRRGIGSDHKKKRGAYAFSADGIHSWAISRWELFPSEIYWDDGQTEFLLKQQRPSLIFDPNSGRVRPRSSSKPRSNPLNTL